MPKRSSRAKLNNNSNNIENNDSNNNCSNSTGGNNNNKSGKESKRQPELSTVRKQLSPTEDVVSPQALETYFGPNELKRQIADALRETSIKNRAKKDQKTRGSLSGGIGGKKGGGATLEERVNAKNSTGGSGSLSEVPKKMIYADVVRNSLAKRDGEDECAVSILKSDMSNSSEWVPEKQDMEKSLVSLGEESQSNENGERSRNCLREGEVEARDSSREGTSGSDPTASTSALSSLLANMDPAILQELEMDDTTWEVISIDDWSQCGSDVDDQFHLISRDDPTTPSSSHATINDHADSTAPSPSDVISKHESSTGRPTPNLLVPATTAGSAATDVTSSKAATASPATTGAPVTSPAAGGGTPSKKKKVVVTRKYIGGVDLAEKLLSLGFQAVEGDSEAADAGAEHWSGVYKNAVVVVSARRRCGLLVASVRAESEALLLALTALQGLIEDTGLLSYANCSLPSLLQQRGVTPST